MRNLTLVEKTAIAIRDLHIQGAINVARSALSALRLQIISENPSRREIEKSAGLLLAQRPTEPALQNLLAAVLRSENPADECDKLLSEIGRDADRIVKAGLPLVKNGSTIITHCHASTVTSLLREARARGTKFSVLHTETRPRFQGHRTARDLVSGGIRQTLFVDSAINYFMPEADLALVGADALLPDGFINKIGTSLLALSAREHRKPLYVVLGLIKFSEKGRIHIEKRPVSELGFRLHGAHLENPAFDFIPRKFVKGVVCEEGILPFKEAVKAARRKISSL